MEKLLTVQETAENLRVSRSTIWRWCRDGTLSSAFKIGRNWRIYQSEVEKIIGQKLTWGDDVGSGNNRVPMSIPEFPQLIGSQGNS